MKMLIWNGCKWISCSLDAQSFWLRTLPLGQLSYRFTKPRCSAKQFAEWERDVPRSSGGRCIARGTPPAATLPVAAWRRLDWQAPARAQRVF